METIEVIQSISTGILAVGLGVAILQLRGQHKWFRKQVSVATKQLKDQHEWYRREKAISYSGLFHPELQSTRRVLQKEFSILSRTEPISSEEILKKLEENAELRIHLGYYLSYFENLALAIFNGVADEDVLFDMTANTLISFRHKFNPFIEYRRKESGNDRLWENFVALAVKWEVKMKTVRTKAPLG